MSIQQLNSAGTHNPQVAGVAATPGAKPVDPAKADSTTVALRALTEDRSDIIPSKPPEDVLDQIAAAGARFDELMSQQRELHFSHDAEANRVVVQVRDLDGNILRTIPPSKALDVISGAPLDNL
jgi:flagellar protein FlaG